jgi:DNA-binding NarL/FixJ family response regulator
VESKVQHVLVLDPDRLCGAMITQTVRGVFPAARVQNESDPAVAAIRLAEGGINLLVVAVRTFDLDIITLLGVWAEHDVDHTRVLLIAPQGNSSAMLALQSLPIHGVFDSTHGDLRELEIACRLVGHGGRYFSETAPARKPAAPTLSNPSTPRAMITTDDRAMRDLRVQMPTARPENTNIPFWRRAR